MLQFLLTLLSGTVVGLLAGWVLTQILRRGWIPEPLHNAVMLMAVLGVFTACDVVL